MSARRVQASSRVTTRVARVVRVALGLAALALAAGACGESVVEIEAQPMPSFPGEELFTTGTPPVTAPGETSRTTAGSAVGAAGATATTVAPSTTTAAAPAIEREVRQVTLQPGDCVVWERADTKAALAPVRVDCAMTHLAEVTAMVDLSSAAATTADYPGADTWDSFVQSVCRREAQTRLGRHDPAGRLAIQAFHPGPVGWKAGERTIYCLVTARSTRLDPVTLEAAVPFTGRAAELDQTLLFAAGTCVATDVDGRLDQVVACTSRHQYEVSGSVDVSAKAATMPADRDAWRAVVAEDCRIVSTTYLRREPRSTEAVFWSVLGEESWNAGRRKLECVLAQVDTAGAPVVRTASLRG